MQSQYRPFKLALCQLKTISNKKFNLKKAASMVKEAAANGADIIMLPECWNTPYTKEFMLKDKEYANDEG